MSAAPPLPEPWETLPPDDYGAWLWEFRRRVWSHRPEGEAQASDAAAEEAAEAERFPMAFADGAGVEESAGAGEGPPEKLIQLVWAEGHLRPGKLFSERGREIEIIQPGRWNGGAGPDFLKAELKIAGRPVRGDVEIHVNASGWRAHAHGDDPGYNGVVLHAFLDNDDNAKLDERQDAEPVERLCLRPFLFPDLKTLERTLEPEAHEPGGPERSDLGACHEAVLALDRRALSRFLDLASRERLEDKVARLRATQGESLDQTIYQALATYLGQGSTKPLFFLLARRASLDALRPLLRGADLPRRAIALQAILFHVAGLIPDAEEREKADLDGEACDYLLEIDRWREAARDYFADRLMPPTRRWFGNVRPNNFPTRLLAGLSRLAAPFLAEDEGALADWLRSLFPAGEGGRNLSAGAKRKLVKSLGERLAVDEPADFWARRYTFGAKPMLNPMKLIGPSRANLLAFNALLPAALLAARDKGDADLESLCFSLYEAWPKLQPNAVTRHMEWKLFAGDPLAADMLDGEARMQALHQIYKDCCDSDFPGAGGCGYFGGGPRRDGGR